RRLFENGVEHRLQIAGRAVDHFEDMRHRGLARQRIPGLVDQPCVLDCDHGLVSKVLKQADLLGRKWPNFSTIDKDSPHHPTILDHRHANDGSSAPEFRRNPDHRLRSVISSVAHLPRFYDAIKMAARRRPKPCRLCKKLNELRGSVDPSCPMSTVGINQKHVAKFRLAEAYGVS